ncbi:hypothetical protein HOO54_19200 [Bacillus sp. WMMC1349]|uniref:metallophosphoesterase n=1 Tax=Bacillus sp. WMMC1349 TaxID=2736254 RepID=UPI0015540853|nr:metallophosphoesterase [Bacillus sp. WMMC1349]NPC94285.1 hypothetical protein [Bacillus sp. WMMC1349]
MQHYINRQTLFLLILASYLIIPIIGAEAVQSQKQVPLMIKHSPVENAKKGNDLLFHAKVPAESVILHYKQHDKLPFRSIMMELEPGTDDQYIAKIKSEELSSQQLVYYIEAKSGYRSVKTDVYTIDIKGFHVDERKLPQLLITEIVVDSTNVGGKDGYEFIEVYNNTNKPIHLNSYKIRYRNPSEGKDSDLLWTFGQEQIKVPSGNTHVLWIKNEANQHLTASHFNRHYGVHLEEGKTLSSLNGSGMENRKTRDLVISTNSGEEIVTAHYQHQSGQSDVVKNKAILYQYPLDGTKQLSKISSGDQKPTPGLLLRNQTPSKSVKVVPDREKPKIQDLTDCHSVNPGGAIELLADVKDNQQLKKVQFFYRTAESDTFTSVNVEKSKNDGFYHHQIFFAELIGKESLQYYMTASDGSHMTSTKKTTITMKQSVLKGLRLNVKNGDTVSGNILLKATSERPPDEINIRIDGQEQPLGKRMIEKKAYFAFDIKKTNLHFKNAVTIGRRVQKIFDDTYHRYTTMTVPISPEEFTKGMPFVITVKAGSKSSTFNHSSSENRDDFLLKNPRLILADGTVLHDEHHSNPKIELPVGDQPNAKNAYDFRFSLSDQSFQSLAYNWDTKAYKQGRHTIEAVNKEDRVVREVTVDNSGPKIKTSLKNGKTYKGTFTFKAICRDKWSEVEKVTALVDGKEISLPYTMSSADLNPGKHIIEIIADDSAGNRSTLKRAFFTKKETPDDPKKLNTVPGSKHATLTVRVKDPTKDKLNVSFFQGYQYTTKDDAHVKISVNRSDTEPPHRFTVNGESSLTKAERDKITRQGFETTSINGFPYHRFDVKVDQQVQETDKVEVKWRGSSLPGRKVSMFVWNHAKQIWETLVYQIAKDEKTFTLKGRMKAKDYLRNSQISVIIQDRIQLLPNDYSFIWMTDTQYYAESYPHIFEKQVNWIASQKDKLNIQYVFHTGDVVDDADQLIQWKRADRYMKVLDDNQIPYGVLAGNHDVDHKSNSYQTFSKYFGEKRFKNKPYYGGAYNHHNKGHYDLISSGGHDYVMISMGWGIGEKELEWINHVLRQYPDRKAILAFHEFLLVSGSRSPLGEKIFEHVIKPNRNVMAVLSGHYHSSNLKIDQLDDDGDGQSDRNVYQMVADYQGGPEGGQGYLRIFHIDLKHDTIHVKTYSPYLDDYNFYDPHQFGRKDEFSMKTDLSPQLKKVRTNHFKMNVYTDKQIGKVRKTKSGKKASVIWKGLKPNTRYYWYTTVLDQYGGKIRSILWRFTTKD